MSDIKIKLRSGFGKEEFDAMLTEAYELGVSDVSIQTGGQIIFHLHGAHLPVTERKIMHYEMGALVSLLYGGDNATSMLAGGRDLDPRYDFQIGRDKKIGFRVNLTQCRVNGERDGYAITMRSLPSKPRLLEELGRPASISDAMFPHAGLVIVVGATGSGKSTLLAGAIRETLEIGRDNKILTYEKPIEYTYDSVVAHPSNIIFQHEIGSHLKDREVNGNDWAMGVRNALRRAPTQILVGESRDKDTINATIEATLTGHTTYTTVHAETVGGAISRMVQSFEYSAHSSITEKLISATRLIVVQRLVRKPDGSGRVALNEWMTFGKEEKRALAHVKSEQMAAHVDNLIWEKGTSMAHHAAYEARRGNVTVEAAAGASGVSPSDIEDLMPKLNMELYETRTERAARLMPASNS